MKRLFYLTALVFCMFTLNSCTKEEEVPEIMKFYVDGVLKDFSKKITIQEYDYGVFIIATSDNDERIKISLPKKGIKKYTEDDYNEMGSGVTKPNIEYKDSKGNYWTYYGESTYYKEDFISIDVKKYDSLGEISGSFSGHLHGSWYNGSSVVDEISITSGEFSHEIETTSSTY